MSVHVHPTAVIEEGAQLADGCIVHAHAHITRYCRLDEGVIVHPFATVGGDPQDLSFQPGTTSGVHIAARTVIREYVTVNRGTRSGSITEIGSDCLVMATAHVAHDCHIGNRVVIANAALLAGHVEVADRALLGGGAVIHQFCRIGENAMIGGGARISQDVPPYCTATERNELIGLNVIGLRRRGLDREVVAQIKRAYQALIVPGGNLREGAASLLASGEFAGAEARNFLQFFGSGRRQFVRPRKGAVQDRIRDE